MRSGLQQRRQQLLVEDEIALDQQERFVDQLSRQPQRVDVVGGREQRADDVLDGDAAEALAEVVAYRLGLVARDDDQALEAVTVEGADQALEDRHPAHGDEALRQRVGQRRQPATEAGGEQQCGPYLRAVGHGVVALHTRSSVLKSPAVRSLDGTPSRWRRRSGRRQEDECECGHRPDRRRQERHSSPLRCDSRGLMPAAQGVGLVHTTRRDPLETRRQEGSGCSAVDPSLSGLWARH